MKIEPVSGENLAPFIPELADLRIRVFREWPYLYNGDARYEAKYLRVYLDCPESLVVLARDDHGAVVGASTCLPLEAADEVFAEPFRKNGIDPATVLYLGESVLLPEYRGQGIGKAFFRERSSHAENLGCLWAAFCAVDRASNDPRRPGNYRSLQPFWTKQGFTRQPQLQAALTWKEVNQPDDCTHTLTFWTRRV